MIHIRIDDDADNCERRFACGIGPALPDGDRYFFQSEEFWHHRVDCSGCNPDGPRDIRSHVDEAARCLFRSMEAESSMVREHFVRMSARLLFTAAALADGEERRILSRYFGQAQALAVFFYGDGRGVSRLLDELRTMQGGAVP